MPMQSHPIWFVLALGTLGACTKEELPDDTGTVAVQAPPETTDRDVPVEDPVITHMQWDCTNDLPTWYVVLDGRASDAELVLARTSDVEGWEERHHFGEPTYEKHETEWSWYVQLEVTDDELTQSDGESTMLDCNQGDASQSWGWTMMLTLYNVSDEPVQCVVGGHNTIYFMSYSCAEYNW